jgi:hypothetical protein
MSIIKAGCWKQADFDPKQHFFDLGDNLDFCCYESKDGRFSLTSSNHWLIPIGSKVHPTREALEQEVIKILLDIRDKINAAIDEESK